MPMKANSPVSRAIQKLASSRAFARVAPSIVPRLDRFLSRISGGRFMSSGGVVPSILLISTGARSGQQRETPLATVPDGKDFFVVGSNFGRTAHPAWSYNLLANPAATVVSHGRRIPVIARMLDHDEKAETWPRLLAIWPTYEVYEERTVRELRVFQLRPSAEQAE